MDKITIISRGMAVVLLFLLAPFASGQVIPEDPNRGGQLFVNKGCAK